MQFNKSLKSISIAFLLEFLAFLYGKGQLNYQIQDRKCRLLFRIFEYLQENFVLKPELDKMSADYAVLKYYMCHVFKEAAGTIMSQYCNMLLLEKAR